MSRHSESFSSRHSESFSSVCHPTFLLHLVSYSPLRHSGGHLGQIQHRDNFGVTFILPKNCLFLGLALFIGAVIKWVKFTLIRTRKNFRQCFSSGCTRLAQ